ncbi:MAG: hypothetical protein C0501_14920 [Isosphaera sp.]|nr:hypothetical protein [Isosphaera sp.]
MVFLLVALQPVPAQPVPYGGFGPHPAGGLVMPGVGTGGPPAPPPPRTPEEARTASLHEAALKGDARAVTAVLTAHPDLVNRRLIPPEERKPNFRDEFTPLHRAVASGKPDVVRLLLAAKADPNARGYEGRTPLHVAACLGHTEIAKILIKAGADPAAKTYDIPAAPLPSGFSGSPPRFSPPVPARSAVEIARAAGHPELAELLTRAGG